MEKYLIIGDVHADFGVFSKAVTFANENNLHLVSLGDLIDNGPDGDKCVELMLSLCKDKKATFIKGNHEHKIIRWCNGNDVLIGPPNQVTIDQFSQPGGEVFKSKFKLLVNSYAHDFFRIGDKNFMAHAGMHKDFWEAIFTDADITKDMINAANNLIELGAKNVLIKGGHLNTSILQNIFVSRNEIKIIKSKRITTKNTHGTGCTLSSAIATFFSCGKSLKKSCELATKYVQNAIGSNLNYGKGQGPINHLNSIEINKKYK